MTNLTLAELQQKFTQLESTYKSERAALEKQMADLKKAGQADAVAKIRSIMTEFGIAPESLTGGKKTSKSSKPSGTVPVKYRGPNGEAWTGRGRQPAWLGENRDQYLIKD
jgi:DNA-binding protein H-NS